MNENLHTLAYRYFGTESFTVNPIKSGGSSRNYYRLIHNDKSVVGVEGTILAENRSFIYLSNYFSKRNQPVSRILAVSDDEMCYLCEDLGDLSLFDCLEDKNIIEHTIRILPRLQTCDEHIDYNKCYPVAEMDRKSIMWDLNYFKYCFLKPTGVELDEDALERDFDLLADKLLEGNHAEAWGFMYRDFQSRNVMIHDGHPRFIDYQGGRRGPLCYDVVSFLWQARAGFTPEFRNEMVDAYLSELSKIRNIDEGYMRSEIKLFVLFRLLQVLGAYGFRGLVQNKHHFIVSIMPALESLRYELNNGVADCFPEIKRLLDWIIDLNMFDVDSCSGLTVHINSFGFRKTGIPRDMSGNGGGFVFDCRSLPNPGRFDEYKALTGRDSAVAEYLEQYEEVGMFFENASTMVLNAVKVYCERGFTHLTVNFGCTGGRHRSVYMAERMARLLGEYDVSVVINHTEQNIKEVKV